VVRANETANMVESEKRESEDTDRVAAVLMLQIGLCFGTPTGLPWIQGVFHIAVTDPYQGLSLMLIQAFLSFITVVLLFLVWLAWVSDRGNPGDHND